MRIFVSSPGDTNHERGRVDRVVERLNGEFAGTVRLETIRWESEFYRAHATFQAQIPEAAECDIVIAVFRHRIGTELPSDFACLPDGNPHPSGTTYEVTSAIEAYHRQGYPDVYVFRHPASPMVRLDDPEAEETQGQWQRLKEFFETWFLAPDGRFKAAFQTFTTVDDFEVPARSAAAGLARRQGLARTRGAVADRSQGIAVSRSRGFRRQTRACVLRAFARYHPSG